MKCMILLFVTIAGCIGMTSCHVNSTYQNRDEDRREGEKVISELYDFIEKGNYDEAYKLFDKKFFDVTDTQKLNRIFEVSQNRLGKIKSYTLENWQTEAIVGTDPKTNYFFVCIVKRSNFDSKETVILEKVKSTIKILGYNVNSDGFFERNKRDTIQ